MHDSAKIIRELANAVIDLRAALFVSHGTPENLARQAATREMDAYLQKMNFSPARAPDPLKSEDRPMRVSGGAAKPFGG